MKKIFITTIIVLMSSLAFGDNCIGNNYEPPIVEDKNPITVTLAHPDELPAHGGRVIIEAEPLVDDGAKPYYEWCTNVGTLESGQDDDRTIHWILPSNWAEQVTQARISVTAGDMLGYEHSAIKYFSAPEGSINLDPDSPAGFILPIYLPYDNTFTIQWQTWKADFLKIEYSYDQKTWSQFGHYVLLGQPNSTDNQTIDNSLEHSTIYFKTTATKGTNNTYGNIVKYNYVPQTPKTADKSTEKPVKAIMKSLGGSTTIHDYIYPAWQRVRDSHGDDNAVYYQVSYADNRDFDDDIAINVGNNLSYKIEDLDDRKSYYVRVRAVNNKGIGDWSNWEVITINLEHKPELNPNTQTPANGAVGVSRTPQFTWEAEDKDNDTIEYYISLGTSSTNLNYHSGWITNKQEFDFSSGFDKPLMPNTTYYWQIKYREANHMSSYYEGGVYPTSPVWSFTTDGTGPDLGITNVVMIDELKIDEWVSFEVTIKNTGTQVADDLDIMPYFMKNNEKLDFKSYSRGNMALELAPNEEETVIVKVQFANKIEEKTFTHYDGTKETISYDNILADGANTVRFAIDYDQFDVDINNLNDTKDYVVNYSLADNLPVIDYSSLVKNSLSALKGDYRYMTGWKVTFKVSAEDQLKIDKYELEYRLSENDEWNFIKSYSHDSANMYESIEWVIPENNNLVTETMQLRAKVYNPSGQFTSVNSPEFKVFENEIDITNISFDKQTYKIGDPILVSYDMTSKYPLERFIIDLNQGSYNQELFEYNIGDGQTLYDNATMQFVIPNEFELIGEEANLSIWTKDINGAYKKVFSNNNFTITQNQDVPKVFNPYEDIFTKQYTNFPETAQADRYGVIQYPYESSLTQDTINEIMSLKIDDNNLAHVIISHTGNWYYSYASSHIDTIKGRLTQYYYMTYNLETKQKSIPILMFQNEAIDWVLPDEQYQDFIINGSAAIMITSNSTTNTITKYQLENNTLTTSVVASDSYAQLINYQNKTYIYHTTDDTISFLKRREIYPNLGNSANVLDEYLGSSIRIHDDLLYFYRKGTFFKLDNDFKVINGSKEEIGLQSKYIRGNIDIYDAEVKELLLDANQNVILLYKNGSQELLFSAIDSDDSDNKMIVSVYKGMIIVIYKDKYQKQYQTIIYDRVNKVSEQSFVGNKSYHGGDIYDIASISEDKQLIIGNPDGDYDAAAQIVMADLTNRLSTVPQINVTSNTQIEVGESTNITWTLSSESNLLESCKVYKVTSNGDELLDTLPSTQRSYSYTHDDIDEQSVVIKVVAEYSNDETSIGQTTLQVINNLSFETFTTDINALRLNEEIEFTWQTVGASSSDTYSVHRQCNHENQWSVLFYTSEQSKRYRIETFSGSCQFKVVSGDVERLLDNTITIDGDIYKFDNNAFTPNGNYTPVNGIVSFSWDITFDESVEFEVFVKKEGEADYHKIASTFDTFYDYRKDLGHAFSWKVSFVVDGKTIESKVVNVSSNILTTSTVSSASFSFINNIPKVSLNYSSVAGATSYVIYRNQYNNSFYQIGTSTTTNYEDISVRYGTNYNYYVVAVNNTTKSLESNHVSVSTEIDESYDVIMDTDNAQVLSGNSILLEYHPNKDVQYENYFIQYGKDIHSLTSIVTTNDRNYTLKDLDYNREYHVQISPLNPTGRIISSVPAKLSFSTGYEDSFILDTTTVSIIKVTEKNVSIAWDNIPNAIEYKIFRKEGSNGYQYIDTITDIEYLDNKNLIAGNHYIYRIKAFANSALFSVSDESEEIIIPYSDHDEDGVADQDDLDDDNDGMPDEYELGNGLNPLDLSDANGDEDEDGYSNLEEYKAETDPQDASSNPLSLAIVGKTKYFRNTIGIVGVRNYDDDNTYTGSVKLANSIYKDVYGTYEIVNKVLTINRISPSDSNFVLNFLDTKEGVLTFASKIDEGEKSTSYFYDTLEERDISMKKAEPAIIMYLLY